MKPASSFFPALLFATLVSTGCDRNDDGEGDSPGKSGQAPAAGVGYIEIQPVALSRTDRLPGRVVPYQVAEIRPQVSGIIQSRSFEEGTFVEEGQKLYQIDPARYEADLQMAEASLGDAEASEKNARLVLDRFEKLIETNAISQQQFDDATSALNRAKASVSMAQAEVKLAQINLEYTAVNSPISGYISPSRVTKGALVTERQETPLATVRQLDPVYVDISQTASEAGDLQARLKASKARDENGAEFPVTLLLGKTAGTYPEKGVLDATDLAVDLQTGAIRLRSIFPNPERVLLPGMFVRASIEDIGRTKEIIVPQKSVGIGPDGEKSVWIIDADDKARKRQVRTGGSYENNWIVLEGLREGDRLIVEGTMGLSEGMAVKPEKSESGA